MINYGLFFVLELEALPIASLSSSGVSSGVELPFCASPVLTSNLSFMIRIDQSVESFLSTKNRWCSSPPVKVVRISKLLFTSLSGSARKTISEAFVLMVPKGAMGAYCPAGQGRWAAARVGRREIVRRQCFIKLHLGATLFEQKGTYARRC